MIRLYDYWRSSAAYRVRMALNLLNLPYERHPVDLVKGEQRGADNVARNPQGLVPTLEIDGLRLTQSLAIIEYLDETRGGLLPKDPKRAGAGARTFLCHRNGNRPGLQSVGARSCGHDGRNDQRGVDAPLHHQRIDRVRGDVDGRGALLPRRSGDDG